MNLIADKQDELAQLCRRFEVERLDLFGSATGDDFDPARSDLDFLVCFRPCPPAEHYERYFGLLEALQALFNRRIDLIESDALRNPYLIKEVEKERVPLYAA
jgi:hypothetical protein